METQGNSGKPGTAFGAHLQLLMGEARFSEPKMARLIRRSRDYLRFILSGDIIPAKTTAISMISVLRPSQKQREDFWIFFEGEDPETETAEPLPPEKNEEEDPPVADPLPSPPPSPPGSQSRPKPSPPRPDPLLSKERELICRPTCSIILGQEFILVKVPLNGGFMEVKVCPSRTLQDDEPEIHRGLICIAYAQCLDYAARRLWKGFSCYRCPYLHNPGMKEQASAYDRRGSFETSHC